MFRIVLAALAVLPPVMTLADEPGLPDDVAGGWQIKSAEPAPWARNRGGRDAAEERRLMDKIIYFQKDRIDGPQPLACREPRYALESVGADLLFDGALTDPEKQAAALGFGDKRVMTLDSGCAIEFHFLDREHALFGLDNTIYRIGRVAPTPPSLSGPE